MWVRCECGHRHRVSALTYLRRTWGGAARRGAGVLLRRGDGRVLLVRRSRFVAEGGTWALPGGAVDNGEAPVDAALRELDEEAGITSAAVIVRRSVAGTDHGVWNFTYVLAELAPQWTDVRVRLNWEADRWAWLALHQLRAMRLHPGLRADLPMLLAALAD